jgi:hypothetical protein
VVADSWWSSWMAPVVPYAVILRLFIEGRIAADEFEVVFLRLYKLDPTDWPPNLFTVLDTLFTDVDAYCAIDQIRAEVRGLDADQLRELAAQALSKLEKLAARASSPARHNFSSR